MCIRRVLGPASVVVRGAVGAPPATGAAAVTPVKYGSSWPAGEHTAPQRCQPDRSGTLDFLLDSCYCDLDMTISVAKKML